MRVTFGKLVQRYVYDVRLGERKVSALYLGDRKIWPTLSDTVYSCVLDVAAVEGSVEWAYWQHALAAVEGGANEERHMRLRAGGREYMLGATFGEWYLAGFDGRATVVFGDNGPLWEKLQPGDEVEVWVVVPERQGVELQSVCEAAVEEVYGLPWLPGTRLDFVVSKGRKKTSAHWDFSVSGMGSGVLHIDGTGMITGHGRGDWQTNVWARGMEVHGEMLRGWDDGYAGGDTGLKVRFVSHNGGTTISQGGVVWPGFSRSIRFRVSAVTRHG